MLDGETTLLDQQPETPSVFIFVPAYGESITTTTFLSIYATVMTLAQMGIATKIMAESNPEISEARNIVTTIWYESIPTTHMLMVDADMGFEPKLIVDMLEVNEPLVGTLYRKKTEEVGWAGSGYPMDGMLSKVAGAHLHPGNFLEVEGVGMGITLVRRDCIANMLAKLPAIEDYTISNANCARGDGLAARGIKRLIRCFDPLHFPERGRLSEDLSFCVRHRMAGGKVWAAIGHDITHVGRKAYTGSFLQHQLQCEARSLFPTDAKMDTSLQIEMPLATEQVIP